MEKQKRKKKSFQSKLLVFQVLEELEEALKTKNQNQLNALTSKFFTLIPHNFGRKRPPVINDLEVLQKKMDMLMVFEFYLLLYIVYYQFMCLCNRTKI